MALVRHARGPRASYNSTTYADYLYFATDTGEILLNGTTYGLSSSDLAALQAGVAGSLNSVTYNSSTHKFTVHFNNGSSNEITLPIASSEVAGLLSTSEKELLSNADSAGGVVVLDENGKVPTSKLPGSYSAVEEYANRAAFPASGTSGTLYLALDTNITYLWSGTTYVPTNSQLALGETASTAYPGNLGKETKDDLQELTEEFYEHLEKLERVYDGGSALSKYGGSRIINCGGAAG